MFGFCPIEINDMEALETEFFKLGSNVSRPVVIDGLLVVVTFGQSDALSVDDVNGRDEFYHRAKKFLRIVSPVFPLFSGWNWQA